MLIIRGRSRAMIFSPTAVTNIHIGLATSRLVQHSSIWCARPVTRFRYLSILKVLPIQRKHIISTVDDHGYDCCKNTREAKEEGHVCVFFSKS